MFPEWFKGESKMFKRLTAVLLAAMLLSASAFALEETCPLCDKLVSEGVTELDCALCDFANGKSIFCSWCSEDKPEEYACSACGEVFGEAMLAFCPKCGAGQNTEGIDKVVMNSVVPPTPTPTMTPTPTPTPTPMPTPTPTPGVQCDVWAWDKVGLTNLGDGTVLVEWLDDGRYPPFEVRYLLRNHDKLTELADDLNAEGSIGYSSVECSGEKLLLDMLVPGEDYWVGVFDTLDHGAYQAYHGQPVQAFTAVPAEMLCWPLLRSGSGESKVPAFTQAQAVDPAMDCGVFLGFSYNNPGEASEHKVQIVLELPDGQKLVMYTAATAFQAKTEDVTGWNFISISPYFAFLQEKLGEVPAGEYALTVYLDGKLAGTQPIVVQPSQATAEDGITLEGFVPQADGSVLVSWSGGTPPYAVYYEPLRSNSFEADTAAGYMLAVTEWPQTSCILEDLAPGAPYWIILTDATGDGRYWSCMPPAAPACTNVTARLALYPMAAQGESKTELPFLPPETAGLQDETDHGAFIRFHYDNPGEAHMAQFRLVFTLPTTGPQVVFRQEVEIANGTGRWLGWEYCSMEDYLSKLRQRLGMIPSGELQVDVYLDNELAATGTLPIGMDW